MGKDNRPEGRKKRVGMGSAKVNKRGSGIGNITGGPVGDSGGYSDKTGTSSSKRAGTGRVSASGAGGSRGARSLLPSKSILVIVAIAVIYFAYTNFMGPDNDTQTSQQFENLIGSTQSNDTSSSYVDKGAYPVSKSVSKLARDKYTTLQGKGADNATIMVYMCGTDLEERAGMATSDLQEMLEAQISDNVNIIVETGGTSKWQNNVINSKTNQRYRVTSKGLQLLEDNLGKKSMVEPNTLTDFIKYCKKNYPADRYALIFWDHGGGSLTAFGYDQHFPNNSMTLDEIATALKNGGCKFDLIGFDACLMATLETAIVLEPYSDYMIASEEVEPGIGWHYTGWVTALSNNTSIPTTDLGKKLIDDYVKEVAIRTPRSQATLSLIDLAELKGTVPEEFVAFSKSTSELIDKDEYKTISDARAGTKEFSPQSKLYQIDLIHFADNVGSPQAKSFADALRGCIKYNRTSTNISNANGVSIFFPYGTTSKLNTALSTYNKIGMDDEYSECIKSFASLTAGGQITSSGSDNLLASLLGGFTGGSGSLPIPDASGSSSSDIVGSLLSSFLSGGGSSSGSSGSSLLGIGGDTLTDIAVGALGNWLDGDRMKASEEYYAENRFDAAALEIIEKDGQRVVSLTDDQWDLVHHMEMNVFLDDGEGFIDLGLDNVYEYNDEGDLIMEYDGTWLALNGNIVSYYLVSDDHSGDSYSIRGRVPALLNGQLVDIIVVFDNDYPDGTVIGAQVKYDTAQETETIAKGLIDIVPGDKIDFLCDYYTYEGQYSDTYYLGEQYTATGEWDIENLSVENGSYRMTYRFTDIYGNRYWTPAITD